MDYLAYDAAHGRIWVPAGNTGNVDVVDVATGKVTAVGGFPTAPPRRPGPPNMGPSSAAVGDGVVWIGNRADDSVCAIDAQTLARGACRQLPSDARRRGLRRRHARGLGDDAARPDDHHRRRLRPGQSPRPATIKIDGDPEGLAVDAARGLFYTNLEDKDRTLAIDAKTRKVVASWPTGCGADGPRGLALDGERRLLFVACTDGAVALDSGATTGKQVGRLKTGGGVDNIDYAAKPGLLLVASGADGTLTFARVETTGALTKVAAAPTAQARAAWWSTATAPPTSPTRRADG